MEVRQARVEYRRYCHTEQSVTETGNQAGARESETLTSTPTEG